MVEIERQSAITSHWYLCRRAARRFVRPGLERADLEQIAAIGLIKAVDRYDLAQNTPFEAYAWVLMIGELMHYVRDCERLLRAPRRIRELERRWICAERDLTTALGRDPEEDEIARHINASRADVRDVREYRATTHVVSIEALRAQSSQPAYTIEGVVEKLAVETVLSELTPLERKIVRAIHIQGISVVELAKRLGYSRRHLTRLHRAALSRLRNGSAAS